MSKQAWPLDHDLFLRSAADTIKKLRNHASIALWCGGNEQTPAQDIDTALQSMLPRRPESHSEALQQCLGRLSCLDSSSFSGCSSSSAAEKSPPGCLDATRAYVSGSLWSGFGEGHGVFSDGPYGCQRPADFFNPSFYQYAFNPEVRAASALSPWQCFPSIGRCLTVALDTLHTHCTTAMPPVTAPKC